MFNGSSRIRPWNLVIYNAFLLTQMISSSFDFLLQSELENFHFYQWEMSISVFKLFYSHNMWVKESYMGFRVCEWSSGENQFSLVTSLRFLNQFLLRENLLIFPVCVIRNIFIRKLSHLIISSPFILINQNNA